MTLILAVVLFLIGIPAVIAMALGGIAIMAMLAVPVLYLLLRYIIPVVLIWGLIGFIFSLPWQTLSILGISLLLLFALMYAFNAIKIKYQTEQAQTAYLSELDNAKQKYLANNQRLSQQLSTKRKAKISHSLEQEIAVLQGFAQTHKLNCSITNRSTISKS